MEDSLIIKIIKVTYGGISRRLREDVDTSGNLAMGMSGLKARIFELFHIPPDTNVSITYIDDGNDVMNLIDDGDLREAMAQDLKCLEITVVNNERVEQGAQQWPNELVQSLQQNLPRGENQDGGSGTTRPPPTSGGHEPRVNESRQVPPQQNLPRGRGEDEDGGHGTTTPLLNTGGDESWVQRLIDFLWVLYKNIKVTMLVDHITYLLKYTNLPPLIQEALKQLLSILKQLFCSVSPMQTM